MIYYQLLGRLDPSLRISWPEYGSTVFHRENVRGYHIERRQADYVVLQYRQTGFDDDQVRWLEGREPVYRLSRHGVPLMDIYAR